jgi:hypothetical protein
MTPLMKSRIDSVVGRETERTLHVEGANIVLSTASTTGQLSTAATYTALFSGSIDPLGTSNFAFELVPASQLAVTADTELSAQITAFAVMGNETIYAEPFNYAITVCTNCIAIDRGPCGTAQPPQNKGDPCNVFQDGAVDCCETTGGGLLCPGP